jgi:hypothetical protein
MSSLMHWQIRKPLVITQNVDAGANYQLGPLTLYYGLGIDTANTFYCNGRCNSDFSDIRFTDENGFLLSYWIQTKTDGVSAVVWVKCTADLSLGSTVIFMYYGNSSASQFSSQADTFVDVISGVVGAWNMEEDHATDAVVDYSGNGNDGTPTGTTIVASKFSGKTSRSFVGASLDKIIVSDDDVLDFSAIQSFSVMVWLKTSTAGALTFVNKEQAWNNERWSLAIKADDHPDFYVYDGDVFDHVISTTHISDGAWHNLIAVRNVVTDKIYGYQDSVVSVPADDPATTLSSTNPLNIGMRQGGVTYYTGVMGNLIIFGGIISQTQANNLYSNYPDVSLEVGKVLVRKYAYPNEQPIYSTIAPVMRRSIIQ